MIKNPENIEADVVLAHGRWCLDRMMTKAGAQRLLSEDRVQLYAATERRVLSVMDQRRSALVANEVAYCEGLAN